MKIQQERRFYNWVNVRLTHINLILSNAIANHYIQRVSEVAHHVNLFNYIRITILLIIIITDAQIMRMTVGWLNGFSRSGCVRLNSSATERYVASSFANAKNKLTHSCIVSFFTHIWNIKNKLLNLQGARLLGHHVHIGANWSSNEKLIN